MLLRALITGRRPTVRPAARHTTRRATRAAAAALAVLAAVALPLVTASPAAAHATVVATRPGDGTVLTQAPTEVSVTFDESVTIAPDSLRVFDPAGTRVDVGGAQHSGGATVAVRLRSGGLARGTYVAAWHVVSADSHPVEGAFTFSLGAASATSVNLASVNPHGSTLVGALYAVSRFVAFLGFAVLVGAVVFLALCWPRGAGRRTARVLVGRAWVLLVAGTVGNFLFQGVYGAASPLTDLLRPQILRSTLTSPLGLALSVRIGVLICLVPLRPVLRRLATAAVETRIGVTGMWFLVSLALAMTWAGADHASVGIQAPAAIIDDSFHLLALACWIGGLVMLVVLVLRPEDPDGESANESTVDEAASAVRRFSRIATVSVGLIALTGVYQAWRGVGSWGALTGTGYGRLVLVKVVAFGGLLGLGYLSRRMVGRIGSRTSAGVLQLAGVGSVGSAEAVAGVEAGAVGAGVAGVAGVKGVPPAASASDIPAMFRRLRRTVATEAIIAIAVLAVSAVLVNTRTGREDTAGPPPAIASALFDTGGPHGRGTVAAELSPARPGRTELRLGLVDTAGRPYTPAQLTVTLTLTARGIGPIAVPVAATTVGGYAAALDAVSLPGVWTLAVTIRSDDIDETTVRLSLPIG